jgi:hypothetical protein
MTISTQERDLINLFRSVRLDGINFAIGGLAINNECFRRVARAIEQERIVVVRGRNDDIGVYDSSRDTLIFPRGRISTDTVLSANAIHEGVHAYCDLSRAVETNPVTEEVAGYLAQSIYLAIRGAAGRLSSPNPLTQAIFTTVDQLARTKGLYRARSTVHLTRADIEPARRAVLAHPLYSGRAGQTRSTHHDGLRSARRCDSLFGVSWTHPNALTV